MKLSRFGKLQMNNPARGAAQRRYTARHMLRLGGDQAGGTALEVGLGLASRCRQPLLTTSQQCYGSSLLCELPRRCAPDSGRGARDGDHARHATKTPRLIRTGDRRECGCPNLLLFPRARHMMGGSHPRTSRKQVASALRGAPLHTQHT